MAEKKAIDEREERGTARKIVNARDRNEQSKG
jgi:hypothetical protein